MTPAKVARGGLIATAAAAVAVPAMSETASAAPTPAAATASVATASNVVVLRYGSTGYYVRVVQQRLHITADGSFGPKTRTAVRNFQSRNHLPVTGVVDARTWAKLGGFPGGTSRSGGTVPTSGSRGARVLAIAKQYQGVPYRWGGSSPSGFDCSGFTQYVYKKLGVNLPRTASAQQGRAHRVGSPAVGDLIFSGFPAYHVAIYAGNGMQIAASKPGTVISVKKIWGSHSYGRV